MFQFQTAFPGHLDVASVQGDHIWALADELLEHFIDTGMETV